jgi:hypothetical protein
VDCFNSTENDKENKVSQLVQGRIANTKTSDSGRAQEPGSWKSLYRIGGTAALMAVLVMLAEIFITFLPGGGATGPGTVTVLDWFALFQNSPLMGLRNLGLINMIATSLAIPMLLSLYVAHRKVDKVYSTLALILGLVGATIYLANNTAFPMLALSEKYAAATTDAQRSLLAAAGEAMLAQAESHAPGTFVGFFYTEISSIAISIVMLRGRIFGKPAAYAGMLGFGLLFIFEILSSFVPAWFDIAMIFAVVGGLSSITWYALIAQGLFQLGKEPSH